MGNTNNNQQNWQTIKPELLLAELRQEIKNDDYFAQSEETLKNLSTSSANNNYLSTRALNKPDFAINFDDFNKLIEPGYLILEDGFVRSNDGSWYIACLIDLGHEIDGEMFDWWFCQCDNTEKYKWWHPKKNKTSIWDAQYYSVMPDERSFGHYIEHTHMIERVVNGVAKTFQFEFLRPSKFFDTEKFSENGITVCLLARIYIKHEYLGFIAIGHLMYQVRQIDGNNELRCRVWIGDVNYPETPENLIFSNLINSVANSGLVKKIYFTEAIAKNFYIHCYEEMHCLKKFLLHYYSINASILRKNYADDARKKLNDVLILKNKNFVDDDDEEKNDDDDDDDDIIDENDIIIES
jgi:hypothetical protein